MAMKCAIRRSPAITLQFTKGSPGPPSAAPTVCEPRASIYPPIALPARKITVLYRIAATIGQSIRSVCTRLAQNSASIQHTIAVLTITMLLVIWAREESNSDCPERWYALRHACAARLRISSATLAAIARRTSVSCHFGIRNASRNRLMVEAKVEKDMENLMGLIHGLIAAVPAGTSRANVAKTGITRRRAQPSRESTGSVASSSRKKLRTDEGDKVCAAARTNPAR